MKKLIILILLAANIIASTSDVELKIYKNILSSIFPNKKAIKVWSDNSKKKKLFDKIDKVEIVSNQNSADILILYKQKPQTSDKIVFIGTYRLLKKYHKEAIGGFYWQKGRPNLLFLRKNLNSHNIHLSKDLEKFIEDNI
ncbi:MAG: hypothetical protein U9P72_07715 [Campylobacterota bacterium]|nr:hypothetical protein [Campylobacterota bacterium]